MRENLMKPLTGALLACLFVMGAGAAHGADFGDKTPSVNEFVDALEPPRMVSKGFRPEVVPRSVSMRIQFDLGSSDIRADDEKKMVNLATALGDDRLKTHSFLVIGHTDASGAPALNMRLSMQRASAARAFLVRRGVDPSRLVAQGKGPVELLVTDDPRSPLNRRVEVALVPK